jgi:prepilin-type N-terminal cleavage/methylation domain-containing protein
MSNEKGFTLIELLVVVAIIGILAAIAIPQFAEYRQRGFRSRVQADLKNVITAQEAYFADSEAYLACTEADCTNLPGISALSDGVTLQVFVDGTSGTFTATASHPRAASTCTYQNGNIVCS